MPHGNVDVLKLRARGNAKVSEQAGEISLKANDPVSALQAIARQAGIKIDLTPEEVAQISGVGKLPLSLSYANNLAGATEAAKKIFDMTGEVFVAQGQQSRPGLWKIIGFVILLLIISVVVFVLTYGALEKAYG